MSSTPLIANFGQVFSTYKRFLVYTQNDKGRFYLDLLMVFLAVITNTMMIWLMGKPLSMIQGGEYDALTSILVLFAIVVLFNQIMQYTGGRLTKWLTLQFMGRVRNGVLSHLIDLSYPVTGQTPKGDILARLSNDIEHVARIIVETRIMMFSHILTLSLYVSMLFWIDNKLALIALATTPMFYMQQRYFSPRRRQATENLLKTGGQLMAYEDQTLSNLRGISTNRSETLVSKLHRGAYEKARAWAMRERALDIGFMVSFTVLIYLVGLLIVLFGIESIKSGEILVGSLVSFLLYLGYLTVPVRGIADAFFQAAGSMGAADRVLQCIDAKPNVVDRENAPALIVDKGDIQIKNLAFAYPGQQPLFHNIHLEITGGSTVALVGPSGSGKSTFATLLLRFYDPTKGAIYIDGVDIRDVSLASLRDNMAVVWQSPFFVDNSIRTNMLMARPKATEEQVIEACKRSHAWEFIQQLPEGLDTPIGAGQIELSGGQKQRLAIAQAFLRDTPILILDEASSALDSEAEQIVVKAINELRATRTTLMIAHRYSSIRSADQVIYFSRNGKTTMATHEQLLEQIPEYRDAVEWQTQ